MNNFCKTRKSIRITEQHSTQSKNQSDTGVRRDDDEMWREA